MDEITLREVLILILLESSGCQCQDGIKHPQHKLHYSYLEETQMLPHILQEIKANTKRNLKILTH
jgi:hypothetical protein